MNGSRADGSLRVGWTPRPCSAHASAPAARTPKTKRKVERVIREVKHEFLAWLAGQVIPERPSVAWYDGQVCHWALTVAATRRHRATGRITAEAWEQERALLTPVSRRLLARIEGETTLVPLPGPARAAQAAAGETVDVRPLAVYAEFAW